MKSHFKLLLVGILVAIAGTLPIYLYIEFGPPDGNPVGLGLLAWLSWLVGLVLFIIGIKGYLSQDK